ncbi:MAG: hypothetical protein HYS07_11305, partial [Chlamydiae bacterium]|nr:hypothetical protein [Chlamydiota bacterium]
MPKFIHKSISIFLIFSFLTYYFSMSYGHDSPVIGPLAVSSLGAIPLRTLSVKSNTLLENIRIPSDVGEIIDQNIIPERPLLFILEDIHCNAEVQKNEERILRALEAEIKDAGKLGSWEAKKQKVSPSLLASQLPSQPFHVFSEAASGLMDMSFFTAFPDKEALKAARKKLLENHDINGLESFLISEGSQKVKGIGIEDIETYVSNAKLMNELMEEKELQENVWSGLEELFEHLRQKIYPKELIELIKKREQYRKIDLREYIKQLEARGSKLEAKTKTKEKTENAENQSLPLSSSSLEPRASSQNYPQLELYIKLQSLEKKMDASKIESEYLKFLSELEKKLPKEAMAEVMRHVLEHRLGRMSDEEHYLYLRRYLE